MERMKKKLKKPLTFGNVIISVRRYIDSWQPKLLTCSVFSAIKIVEDAKSYLVEACAFLEEIRKVGNVNNYYFKSIKESLRNLEWHYDMMNENAHKEIYTATKTIRDNAVNWAKEIVPMKIEVEDEEN